MFWGTIGGRGTAAPVTPGVGDFASSYTTDFSTSFVNIFDETVLLLGTDDGSSIGPSGNIQSASFGQAGAILPRFAGDQVVAASTISFSAGSIETPPQFLLAQPFDPTKSYVLAFFTSTGVNYRVVIAATAWLSTLPTFTSTVRLEYRWGIVNGMASTLIAGGVTTYSDNGTAGSNQSAATIPSGTYTPVANQLLFLEKVAVFP